MPWGIGAQTPLVLPRGEHQLSIIFYDNLCHRCQEPLAHACQLPCVDLTEDCQRQLLILYVLPTLSHIQSFTSGWLLLVNVANPTGSVWEISFQYRYLFISKSFDGFIAGVAVVLHPQFNPGARPMGGNIFYVAKISMQDGSVYGLYATKAYNNFAHQSSCPSGAAVSSQTNLVTNTYY